MAAFVFCLFVSSSNASVYKWVDEKGKVWITDYPNPKAHKHEGAHAEGKPAGSQPALPESDSSVKSDAPDSVKPHDGNPFSVPRIPADFRKGMPADEAAILGLMAMMSGFTLIFLIVFYIYASVCLYLIAKKTGVSNPWLAWIPLANLWVMVTAAGKEWWWILLMFVPLVGVAVVVYLWMCITENVGKDKWLGLLIMVPIVNMVWMGILAFSKQEYQTDLIEDQA